MTHLRLKIGAIEIDYEGEQSFIEERFVAFAQEVIALSEKVPRPPSELPATALQASNLISLSTNTIAQITDVKTGSDLALAAIAKINLIDKKGIAERNDILDEMREATTYFKESFASNLTSYLDTLVKAKRVNLQARGAFALAAPERNRLEQAIQGAM